MSEKITKTEQKTAIVTGGGRGIGLGITQRLLQDGYTVVIVGRTTPSTDIGQAQFVQADISNQQDRTRIIQTATKINNRLDLLVNNAGVPPKTRVDLLEMTEESYDHVLGINLKGTMFLSQAAAAQMVTQDKDNNGLRGTIINISSVSATMPSINRGEYCISKAGLSMVTQLFAARLAKESIPIYEIRPGVIDTDMLSEQARTRYTKMLQEGGFPMNRWGTPQDIADVVAFMATGTMKYTTGQVINIDGGLEMKVL